MGKKIGIMGGTFNPIHKGHVALAEAAFDYCQLDEVWFMPSGVSYLKKNDDVLSGEHRLRMTELAIEGYPYFRCSDMEVLRSGNTYTADTLQCLSRQYPEDRFYFIMGADSLMGLPRWKSPDVIAKLCTIVAVVRDDVDMQALKAQEAFLKEQFQADTVLVPFHKVEISSSEIRSLLGKLNRAVPETEVVQLILEDSKNWNVLCELGNMLPEKVLSYILEHDLYLSKESCSGK